jgi:hypothetical protein
MSKENQDAKSQAIRTKVETDFPEFADALNGAKVEDLKKKLLEYAIYREQTVMAQKVDEALEKAKNTVKELNAPYNETLNAIKIKSAYINILLEEKDASEKA